MGKPPFSVRRGYRAGLLNQRCTVKSPLSVPDNWTQCNLLYFSVQESVKKGWTVLFSKGSNHTTQEAPRTYQRQQRYSSSEYGQGWFKSLGWMACEGRSCDKPGWKAVSDKMMGWLLHWREVNKGGQAFKLLIKSKIIDFCRDGKATRPWFVFLWVGSHSKFKIKACDNSVYTSRLVLDVEYSEAIWGFWGWVAL